MADENDLFELGGINDIVAAPEYAAADPEHRVAVIESWGNEALNRVQRYAADDVERTTISEALKQRIEQERAQALGADEISKQTAMRLAEVEASFQSGGMPDQQQLAIERAKVLSDALNQRREVKTTTKLASLEKAGQDYEQMVSSLSAAGTQLPASGVIDATLGRGMDMVQLVLAAGAGAVTGNKENFDALRPKENADRATEVLKNYFDNGDTESGKLLSKFTDYEPGSPEMESLRDAYAADFRRNGRAASKLSTGGVLVNPELAFDKAGWDAAVDALDVPDEVKAAAKANREKVREDMAVETGRKLMEFPTFREFAYEFRKGKSTADYTEGELVEAYKKTKENDKDFWRTLWVDTKAAATGLNAQGAGLLGLMGSQWAREHAQSMNAAAAGYTASAEELGRSVAGSVAKFVANDIPFSVAPSLVGGMGAAKLFTSKAAQLTAMSTVAGAQSTGGSFADMYSTLRNQGMSDTDAWKGAAVPAVLSGVLTGALTRMMGGGFESATLNAGSQEAKKSLIRAFGVEGGKEIPEEVFDQWGSDLIDKAFIDPNKSFGDLVRSTGHTALIALFSGGSMGAARQLDANRSLTQTLGSAAHAAKGARTAQDAGMPQTAEELRKLAEKEMNKFKADLAAAVATPSAAPAAGTTPTPTTETTQRKVEFVDALPTVEAEPAREASLTIGDDGAVDMALPADATLADIEPIRNVIENSPVLTDTQKGNLLAQLERSLAEKRASQAEAPIVDPGLVVEPSIALQNRARNILAEQQRIAAMTPEQRKALEAISRGAQTPQRDIIFVESLPSGIEVVTRNIRQTPVAPPVNTTATQETEPTNVETVVPAITTPVTPTQEPTPVPVAPTPVVEPAPKPKSKASKPAAEPVAPVVQAAPTATTAETTALAVGTKVQHTIPSLREAEPLTVVATELPPPFKNAVRVVDAAGVESWFGAPILQSVEAAPTPVVEPAPTPAPVVQAATPGPKPKRPAVRDSFEFVQFNIVKAVVDAMETKHQADVASVKSKVAKTKREAAFADTRAKTIKALESAMKSNRTAWSGDLDGLTEALQMAAVQAVQNVETHGTPFVDAKGKKWNFGFAVDREMKSKARQKARETGRLFDSLEETEAANLNSPTVEDNQETQTARLEQNTITPGTDVARVNIESDTERVTPEQEAAQTKRQSVAEQFAAALPAIAQRIAAQLAPQFKLDLNDATEITARLLNERLLPAIVDAQLAASARSRKLRGATKSELDYSFPLLPTTGATNKTIERFAGENALKDNKNGRPFYGALQKAFYTEATAERAAIEQQKKAKKSDESEPKSESKSKSKSKSESESESTTTDTGDRQADDTTGTPPVGPGPDVATTTDRPEPAADGGTKRDVIPITLPNGFSSRGNGSAVRYLTSGAMIVVTRLADGRAVVWAPGSDQVTEVQSTEDIVAAATSLAADPRIAPPPVPPHQLNSDVRDVFTNTGSIQETFMEIVRRVTAQRARDAYYRRGLPVQFPRLVLSARGIAKIINNVVHIPHGPTRTGEVPTRSNRETKLVPGVLVSRSDADKLAIVTGRVQKELEALRKAGRLVTVTNVGETGKGEITEYLLPEDQERQINRDTVDWAQWDDQRYQELQRGPRTTPLVAEPVAEEAEAEPETESSKAVTAARERLEDLKVNLATRKQALAFFKKLHAQGMISDVVLAEATRVAKDKDMDGTDVLDVVLESEITEPTDLPNLETTLHADPEVRAVAQLAQESGENPDNYVDQLPVAAQEAKAQNETTFGLGQSLPAVLRKIAETERTNNPLVAIVAAEMVRSHGTSLATTRTKSNWTLSAQGLGGVHVASTNTVHLNPLIDPAQAAATIVHEAGHAITRRALDLYGTNPDALPAPVRQAITDLKSVRQEVLSTAIAGSDGFANVMTAQAGAKRRAAFQKWLSSLPQAEQAAARDQYYGLLDDHEFVSETLTNRGFQTFLNGLQSGVAAAHTSVWAKVKAALRAIFFNGRRVNEGSALAVAFDSAVDLVAQAGSVSADKDTEYMDAVRRGDMTAAQRMVDEAAEKAGYKTAAFHGSPREDLTSIRGDAPENTGRGKSGAVFLSSSQSEANYYRRARSSGVSPQQDADQARFNQMIGEAFKNPDLFQDEQFDKELTEINRRLEGAGKTYALRVKLNNPIEVDASNFVFAPRVMREMADGNPSRDFVFKDALDSQSAGASDIYVVRNPAQIKSADPVTYDSDGNPIPLSQRFNDQSDDIRYSVTGLGGIVSEQPTGVLSPEDAFPLTQEPTMLDAGGNEVPASQWLPNETDLASVSVSHTKRSKSLERIKESVGTIIDTDPLAEYDYEGSLADRTAAAKAWVSSIEEGNEFTMAVQLMDGATGMTKRQEQTAKVALAAHMQQLANSLDDTQENAKRRLREQAQELVAETAIEVSEAGKALSNARTLYAAAGIDLTPKEKAKAVYVNPTRQTQETKLNSTAPDQVRDTMGVLARGRKAAAQSTGNKMLEAFLKLYPEQEQMLFEFFDAMEKTTNVEDFRIAAAKLEAAIVADTVKSLMRATADNEALAPTIEDEVRKQVREQFNELFKAAPTAKTELGEFERMEAAYDMLGRWTQANERADSLFNTVRDALLNRVDEVADEFKPLIESLRGAQASPLASSDLTRAVRVLLPVRQLVRESLAQRDMKVASVVSRIGSRFPTLSEANLAQLETAIRAAFAADMQKYSAQEVAKLHKQWEKKQKPPENIIEESDVDKLVRYLNAGALDDEAAYNMLAEKHGLQTWTVENVEWLRNELEQVMQQPEGRPRQFAEQKVMNQLARRVGQESGPLWGNKTKWRLKLLDSFWVSGALSGPPTQIVNTTATAVNVFQQLAYQALARRRVALNAGASKEEANKFITDVLHAYKFAIGNGAQLGPEKFKTGSAAMQEFAAAWKTGATRFSSEAGDSMSPLEAYEFEKLPDNLSVKQLRAWLFNNYAALNKYVGRSMLAADALNRTVARSGFEIMEMRSEAITRNLEDSSDSVSARMERIFDPTQEILDEIEADIKRHGLTGDDAKRRYHELLETRVFSTRAVKLGEAFAQKASYNNTPTSATARAIHHVLGTFLRIPLLGRATVGFPRTLANLIDQTLDMSPLGYMRAGVGRAQGTADSLEGGKIKKGSAEYYALVSQANAGTAALGVLAMIVLGLNDDDDEDEVLDLQGTGPQDYKQAKQARDAGIAQSAVSFGPVSITYSDMPGLGMWVGMFAAVRDMQRYDKRFQQLNRDEQESLIKPVLLRMASATLDRNMLGGVNKLMKAVLGKEYEQGYAIRSLINGAVDGFTKPAVTRWLSNTLTAREAGFDMEATFGGWLMNRFPVLPDIYGKTAFNALGQDISDKWWEPTSRRFVQFPGTDAHPVLTPLVKQGLFLPVVTGDVQLAQDKTLRRDDPNFYDYSRAYSEKIGELVTPEYVQRMTARIDSAATPEAKLKAKEIAQKQLSGLSSAAHSAGRNALAAARATQ